MVCPQNAIFETERPIGKVVRGASGNIQVTSGILNMGEESGVPIIRTMLKDMKSTMQDLIMIDCPPGSACVVMESIADADFCILVAEPTVFGVHNLNMVYELVQLFKKPYGVVLNKCLGEDNPAEDFCTSHNIPILGRIPFDRELGKLNSDAEIVSLVDDNYHKLFSDILQQVKEAMAQ